MKIRQFIYSEKEKRFWFLNTDINAAFTFINCCCLSEKAYLWFVFWKINNKSRVSFLLGETLIWFDFQFGKEQILSQFPWWRLVGCQFGSILRSSILSSKYLAGKCYISLFWYKFQSSITWVFVLSCLRSRLDGYL